MPRRPRTMLYWGRMLRETHHLRIRGAGRLQSKLPRCAGHLVKVQVQLQIMPEPIVSRATLLSIGYDLEGALTPDAGRSFTIPNKLNVTHDMARMSLVDVLGLGITVTNA
jgi:hypothetical protein